MERQEACLLLTKIASSELIDKTIGKEILKARDIVVCEQNKILDVLATEATRKKYLRILEIYIDRIINTLLIDKDTEKKLIEIMACIHEGDDFYEFKDPCTEIYLPTRCKDCPNYRRCNG